MNDRKRAEDLLEYIELTLCLLSEPLHDLQDILGKNQNRPPLGQADGSFTPEIWIHMRDTLQCLATAARHIEDLKMLPVPKESD